MELKPNLKPIDEHKTLINIGATLDIPTGYWIRGIHGENILMGGLGQLTGIAGPGNMYKSTILHYMLLSAMSKIWLYTPTSCSTYDSETNIHTSRLKAFTKSFPQFKDRDIIEEGYWVISDSGTYFAEEFYSIIRSFMKDKKKNAKQLQAPLPFKTKDGKQATEILPTFTELDSLTAMQFSSGIEIIDKNEIGSSGGSHINMREGLAKHQMLHEIPSFSTSAKHFILSTAHVGNNNAMQTGHVNTPPKKQLQFLSTDTRIKGVTGQYLYLQHNFWMVTNCVLLWNKDDKTPKYPKVPGEAIPGDIDLNLVTMQHIRGKAGPSGYKLDIVVSQSEGVLPTLTEFHFLKDYSSFGFDGNDRTYRLFIYPEETLTRTTVRQKIDNSKKLRRAMNITSELAQMYQFHRAYADERLMSPEDLATKLKTQGYDLNFIMENTRGWWTYNNDYLGDYYLSTLDLLDMANGIYHPYWLEDDRKTVKKEYLRK